MEEAKASRISQKRKTAAENASRITQKQKEEEAAEFQRFPEDVFDTLWESTAIPDIDVDERARCMMLMSGFGSPTTT